MLTDEENGARFHLVRKKNHPTDKRQMAVNQLYKMRKNGFHCWRFFKRGHEGEKMVLQSPLLYKSISVNS